MKKTVLLLIVLGIASKSFGLFREIILSYFYGVSAISDAYLISITIPTIIFGLIVNGITTGYIPLVSSIQNKYGLNSEFHFTNNLVNMLLFLSTLVMIIGFIFTEPLVKIFAFGFENDTLLLAIKFTRISLISIYFSGIICLFNGLLQIHKNFISPALIGIPFNGIIVLFIVLSSFTDPIMLPVGIIIATFSQLIFLIPFVYKKGYRYRFVINLRDEYIKKLAFLTMPLVLGVSVNQLNEIVDKTLASQIVIGGVSALNYADRVNGLIQGIFVLSISTVIYPLISKMAAENNINRFKETLASAICCINLIILPSTVGVMVFAEPIIKLLFGRGAFDSHAITLTTSAYFYYSIGMIGYGLREILSRAFFSLQDTKTPMINAVIAVITNILLSLVLSRYFGIGGLALATSISGIFCAFLLMASLRNKIGHLGLKVISKTSLKLLTSSLIMGVVGKIAYTYLFEFINHVVALLISITIASTCYFIIVYFMKIKEFDFILKTCIRECKLKLIYK